MRVAIIENGTVVNVVMATELPHNGVETTTAGIGFTYDGVTFAPPVVPTVVDYSVLAQVQLALNDKVAIRCTKAGVSYPSEWQTYDTRLRSIVASGVGPLPTQPSYPAGT